MPAVTLNQIVERRRMEADKLMASIPVGTIVSVTPSPDRDPLWESADGQRRAVFLGVGDIYPYAIRVQPDESDREWTIAHDEARFWLYGRWWTFADIIGKE